MKALVWHGRNDVRCDTVPDPRIKLLLEFVPDEPLRYPVSEVAAKYGASVATETGVPDEAYADWPGEYEPLRLPWPVESAARWTPILAHCVLP